MQLSQAEQQRVQEILREQTRAVLDEISPQQGEPPQYLYGEGVRQGIKIYGKGRHLPATDKFEPAYFENDVINRTGEILKSEGVRPEVIKNLREAQKTMRIGGSIPEKDEWMEESLTIMNKDIRDYYAVEKEADVKRQAAQAVSPHGKFKRPGSDHISPESLKALEALPPGLFTPVAPKEMPALPSLELPSLPPKQFTNPAKPAEPKMPAPLNPPLRDELGEQYRDGDRMNGRVPAQQPGEPQYPRGKEPLKKLLEEKLKDGQQMNAPPRKRRYGPDGPVAGQPPKNGMVEADPAELLESPLGPLKAGNPIKVATRSMD